MSLLTTFRLAQHGFGNSKWTPGPLITDDEGWARGLALLGHARDMGRLDEPQRERLIHLLKVRIEDDSPEEDELAALLSACDYMGPQCFDDVDTNDKSALWASSPVEVHRETALGYARARDAAWRELGIVPRWWSSNDKGGLHGDVPPVPDELKSPHLPRAWQRLSWHVNERASLLHGSAIPIGSRLPSRSKLSKPPVYLDDTNHNRYRDGRGAVWRIGFAAKPEPGKHRRPIDIATGTISSATTAPPMLASDWTRVLPILRAFVARIEREEAPKPKRTPKPAAAALGIWDFDETPPPAIRVPFSSPPPIVLADREATDIWNNPSACPDRSKRDFVLARRLVALGLSDPEIANLLESMPGSKCGTRNRRYTNGTVKSARNWKAKPYTAAIEITLAAGLALAAPALSAFDYFFAPEARDATAQELQAAREDRLEREAIMAENVSALAAERGKESKPGWALSSKRVKEQELRNMARELAWASLHDATLTEKEKKTLERYAECYLRGVGRKCNGIKKNGQPCTHVSCRAFRCSRDACPFCVTRNHQSLLGCLREKLVAEDLKVRSVVPDAVVAGWYVMLEAPPDPQGFKAEAKRIKKRLHSLESGKLRTYYGPLTMIATRDQETATELARVTGKHTTRVESMAALEAPVKRVLDARATQTAAALRSYNQVVEAAGHKRVRVGQSTVVDPGLLTVLRAHEFRQWLGHVSKSTAGKSAQLPWPSAQEVQKFAQKAAAKAREEKGLVGPDDCREDPDHGSLYLGEHVGWTFPEDGGKGTYVVLKKQPGIGQRPKRADVFDTLPLRC